MIIKTGTDLSYLNYGNNDLTGQVTLSQIVTANDVTDMRYMYANCPNITSVIAYQYSSIVYTYEYVAPVDHVSYIDDNIKYSYDFHYSYTYSYNVVTDFKQPKTGFVKNMSNMFANCYSLTEANLAYMNFSECTDMQGMFKNCYNLETVVFGRYACNALLHMQDIFAGCYGLDRIYVPFELKDDVEYIIGQSGLHSYYYKAEYNIEDTLPTIAISYSIDNVKEIERYTTVSLNKIGALVVESEYDYGDNTECVINIYGCSSYTNDVLMFSYTASVPSDRSSLELSDIGDSISYDFILANEFNIKATLSCGDNTKTISYKIDNSSYSRYIDLNAYLIYFSDDDDGVPEGQSTTYEQAKSRIVTSTYNWFFSDIKRIKNIDHKTFTTTYSYESSFDTYNNLLTLNNELDDNYDGPQTIEPVHVDFVYAYYFN